MKVNKTKQIDVTTRAAVSCSSSCTVFSPHRRFGTRSVMWLIAAVRMHGDLVHRRAALRKRASEVSYIITNYSATRWRPNMVLNGHPNSSHGTLTTQYRSLCIAASQTGGEASVVGDSTQKRFVDETNWSRCDVRSNKPLPF